MGGKHWTLSSNLNFIIWKIMDKSMRTKYLNSKQMWLIFHQRRVNRHQ